MSANSATPIFNATLVALVDAHRALQRANDLASNPDVRILLLEAALLLNRAMGKHVVASAVEQTAEVES